MLLSLDWYRTSSLGTSMDSVAHKHYLFLFWKSLSALRSCGWFQVLISDIGCLQNRLTPQLSISDDQLLFQVSLALRLPSSLKSSLIVKVLALILLPKPCCDATQSTYGLFWFVLSPRRCQIFWSRVLVSPEAPEVWDDRWHIQQRSIYVFFGCSRFSSGGQLCLLY